LSAIIPRWPDRFRPNSGKEVPADLIGAVIVAIGTSEELIEGGGLLIDYQPRDSAQVRRLVLAFTETGMWVMRQSILDGGLEWIF
jgi:hypothetical protein